MSNRIFDKKINEASELLKESDYDYSWAVRWEDEAEKECKAESFPSTTADEDEAWKHFLEIGDWMDDYPIDVSDM